jgi:hypothetical protein
LATQWRGKLRLNRPYPKAADFITIIIFFALSNRVGIKQTICKTRPASNRIVAHQIAASPLQNGQKLDILDTIQNHNLLIESKLFVNSVLSREK